MVFAAGSERHVWHPPPLLPTSPTKRRMRRSHRAIPLLLASYWLWQPEGLQRCRSKTTGHLQPVIALITRDGHARLRAINTVDHTAIVTLHGQVRLDGTDHRHLTGRMIRSSTRLPNKELLMYRNPHPRVFH